MNPAPQELSPLAVEMIERCTRIVLHSMPACAAVKVKPLTVFSIEFRNRLRAGHCVCIRREALYTVPLGNIGPGEIAGATVLDLQMTILPPKQTVPAVAREENEGGKGK